MKTERFTSAGDRHPSRADLVGPVYELSLLLPQQQVKALQRFASRAGLTMGALLRRLVADFLRDQRDGRLQLEPPITDGLELKGNPRPPRLKGGP